MPIRKNRMIFAVINESIVVVNTYSADSRGDVYKDLDKLK